MPRTRRATQTSVTPTASQLIRSRHYHRRVNIVLDGDTEVAEGNSVFLAPKEHTLEECRKPENHHLYDRAFVDALYEHTGTGRVYMVGSIWKHPDQLDPEEFDARDRAVVTQALIPFELIRTEEQRVWPVTDIEARMYWWTYDEALPGRAAIPRMMYVSRYSVVDGKLAPVKEFCTCKEFYNVNTQQQRYCTTCLQWFCEVHCGSGSGPVRAAFKKLAELKLGDVGGLRALPIVRGLGGAELVPESWWRVVGSWSLGFTTIGAGDSLEWKAKLHPDFDDVYEFLMDLNFLMCPQCFGDV
ncbi:hypothetical protein FA15DRAFT_672262 [Coprinopsis marcescibilis]|uniref:BAH domain-containing protein n=1 Tax=Coprinopsis marcescibilis TaxID=230819 RepID=A0A5C3KN68_COPMA|nr:hypothetical protein FA15DRAFT_672262 [Coprinopsis marcescibilis]